MRIIVENGLPAMLVERRIRSASAFARLMAPYLGKQLSTSQITRYMRDTPPAFDLNFVGAACSALRCLPTDLYRIRIECENETELSELGPIPKFAEVVIGESRQSTGKRAKPEPIDSTPAGSKPRQKVEPSVHAGPKADVFPFRKK